jgi:hypothetical protein
LGKTGNFIFGIWRNLGNPGSVENPEKDKRE